ncbi:MAG TPA: ACT domain-containing protein, partial [Terriglobales bacterium]
MLNGTYAVCRFGAVDVVPQWALGGVGFTSVTRTDDELSIVCEETLVPADQQRVEHGWRAFKLQGPIPFEQTGVLSSLISPLAEAGVEIFAISTFDTDYVLVKAAKLE